jgi:hypothetical protein
LVKSKLFCTLAFDVRKRTPNSGVCVPTIDGETYFEKLTKVIEVEYFDRTKYVMFKCDCVDSTRDKGYKVDEYDLIFVNFKNFVNKGDMITNEQYVLTSQVDQVFYIEDERGQDWAYAL